MTKGHQEIERILAVYRDASSEEQLAVDAHVKACSQCARLAVRYDEVDYALRQLPQPGLPAGLSRPFASLLTSISRSGRTTSQSPRGAGFVLRGLAPVSLILFLAAALSVVLWSVNSINVTATLTPTLTTTLTPTTSTTRQVEVDWDQFEAGFVSGRESGPTPAPVPAPVAQRFAASCSQACSPVLLVGYRAHARMTN